MTASGIGRDGASPRVCIIGAGPSGITAAKALLDAGVPFDCFEKSDRVGGNWVFRNRNRMNSVYRSLCINSSRIRSQYSDFPMPKDYPDYPSHQLLSRYFDAYVDHFGLRERIQFESEVCRVEPHTNGAWSVVLAGGSEHRYAAVGVANGHHWDPRWPEPPFEGEFRGVQMHSHDYIDPGEPHPLFGKRVLVVGMGNSAMDIACELSAPGVAQRVYLAARRGAYILPKYLLGRPLDESAGWIGMFPRPMRSVIARSVYRLVVGRPQDYGLPVPDHPLGGAHPTISSDIFERLNAGRIIVKPNILKLRSDVVEFRDGSFERVEAIIFCTGYKVTFPFFDQALVSAPDNDLPLFRRVFSPDHPGLFFFGLCQPVGAVMPIAEAQGKWVAQYVTGKYALPSRDAMRQDIETERKRMSARYVPSKRHTMQIDVDQYLPGLRWELAAGRRRAQRVTGRRSLSDRG
jgi:thioredoxin reductase